MFGEDYSAVGVPDVGYSLGVAVVEGGRACGGLVWGVAEFFEFVFDELEG